MDPGLVFGGLVLWIVAGCVIIILNLADASERGIDLPDGHQAVGIVLLWPIFLVKVIATTLWQSVKFLFK